MGLTGFARRYMVPYLPWYLGGTVCLIATNWLSVTIPLHLASAIDAFRLGPTGAETVTQEALLIGLMGLVVIAVRTASRVLYFTPGRLVEAAAKRDLFSTMLEHQPAFLRQWPTGDLFSRVSSDINMLRLMAGFGVLQAANSVIAIGLAGTQMTRLSPTLAGYIVLPVGAALVVVQLFIRRLFVLMQREQVQRAELSDTILSTYQGVATVQGFVAEDAFLGRFDGGNEAYLATMLGRARIRVFLSPVLELATGVGVFILLYIGGPLVLTNPDLTVGELVAFISLVAFLVGPLRATSFLVSVFKQGQAALERVDAILQVAPDHPEGPQGATAPTCAPALEVRHLSFTYPGATEPTLRDLSFQLPAGGTLGVFGLTGSGKTTLLRCLARLYNPPAGTVFVDGVDLTTLDLCGWRDRMTFVRQRPFLFSESVADNILLGRDAPDLLDQVLDDTALTPDIAALPDGTGTLVGESGVRLSGGQRQRTALARGLSRDHCLLLLDDVLSAVDHATEHQLIHTLRGEASRPTTVLVAHRLSALQHADLVLVLDEGRLVDQGTPAELAERPGLYRDTWQQQQAAEVSP